MESNNDFQVGQMVRDKVFPNSFYGVVLQVRKNANTLVIQRKDKYGNEHGVYAMPIDTMEGF